MESIAPIKWNWLHSDPEGPYLRVWVEESKIGNHGVKLLNIKGEPVDPGFGLGSETLLLDPSTKRYQWGPGLLRLGCISRISTLGFNVAVRAYPVMSNGCVQSTHPGHIVSPQWIVNRDGETILDLESRFKGQFSWRCDPVKPPPMLPSKQEMESDQTGLRLRKIINDSQQWG